MELKVYEIQKSLINQQMTPKHQETKKKVVSDDTRVLFADVLNKTLDKY